jgi:hypothetical protein
VWDIQSAAGGRGVSATLVPCSLQRPNVEHNKGDCDPM